METKQYPAIDIAKFICALIILMYHYFSEHGPVFWILEESLSLYAIAVALFMTISGYLTFSKIFSLQNMKDGWSIICRQVKRILFVYVIWSMPYLIFSISTWKWKSGQVTFPFVLSKIQGWIFQSTFYTIWFMPALALGLLLAYILYVKFSWRSACIIGVILYALGSLQSTYSFVFNDVSWWRGFISFSNTWLQGCRGGIFFGTPLILLGGCAAKIKWRKAITLGILSVISLMGILVEALILRIFVGGCGLDLAVMMLPTCLFTVMVLTSFSWRGGAICKWMRSMSVLIFMSQRLFLTVIPHYFNQKTNDILFGNPYFGAVVFCGVTLLFSDGIIELSKKYEVMKRLY